MASKLATCFVCWNLSNSNNHTMRSQFPLSCKMPHHRTISCSQQKRQYHKKTSSSQPSSIDGGGGPLNPKSDDFNRPIVVPDTNNSNNSTPSVSPSNSPCNSSIPQFQFRIADR